MESLRAHVKERHKTKDFFPEFDASVTRMEEYVQALEVETRERASLIKLLEQGDAFYENQKGEFKQVFTVSHPLQRLAVCEVSLFNFRIIRHTNNLETVSKQSNENWKK